MTARERVAKRSTCLDLLQRYEQRPVTQVVVRDYWREQGAAGTLVRSAIASAATIVVTQAISVLDLPDRFERASRCTARSCSLLEQLRARLASTCVASPAATR